MHDVWLLATDDERERRVFADLDAVLALPHEAAGPPNRLRRVVRLGTPSGICFLKVFTRTQWKNRLRFRWTMPHARDDAERELLVTRALRSAGFDAPRPLAYGRRGPSSYYLCAALAGTPCHELLAAGRADAALVRQVAEHCGRLLAAGFLLPDLAADHVFATRTGERWDLAVLDLHNGALGPRGPVPRRVAVRVLRRFARSVRGLPLRWPTALAFTARLLRAAGRRGDEARAVLSALSPIATALRYETPGASDRYATRNPARTARELRLLERVWPGHPSERVLDLPCGTGRLEPMLRAHGHVVVQADGALAMLRQAAARTPAGIARCQADAFSIPFTDGSVDGVVTFRFLHHLTADARVRAIAEACRVARRFVVVSFFHPCSFHHLRRRLASLGGRAPTRFAVRLGAIAAEFATHGFNLHRTAADLPFARDLWVASFVRTPQAGALPR